MFEEKIFSCVRVFVLIGRYAAVAEEHAECSVCFEPLCESRLAVFAKV